MLNNIKYIDVTQNEPEWFALRSGKITSSKLGCIMANYGKAFGDPAKKYAVDLALEQITGEPIQSGFQNENMDKGHIQEPIARSLYESATFQTVQNGGFFYNNFFGTSPDGILNNGLIEIKSSITPWAHYERIRKQDIDSAYKWQVIGNLYITGEDWLDFVSYCEFFPEEKRLFILRVTPDMFSKEFSQLKKRTEQFLELVENIKLKIINAKYI